MKRTYIQPCAVAFATATTGQLLAGSNGSPEITDEGGSGNNANTAKGNTFADFEDEDEEERAYEVAQSLSQSSFSLWD